jgi:hypothetical protein
MSPLPSVSICPNIISRDFPEDFTTLYRFLKTSVSHLDDSVLMAVPGLCFTKFEDLVPLKDPIQLEETSETVVGLSDNDFFREELAVLPKYSMF